MAAKRLSVKQRTDSGKAQVSEMVAGEGEKESQSSEDDVGREVKFAQYVDSDEAAEQDDDEDHDSDEDSEEDVEGDEQEDNIRKRVESIPFSSLLRARKSLREIESNSSDSEEDEFEAERVKHREEKEKVRRVYKDMVKRENKHAPTEVSSRRPVSRRRIIVETQSNASRRDPRFSSLSASLPNSGLYQSSYGFLREKQRSEVAELKSVYNKLKRQEVNHAGPKARSEIAQSIRQEKEEVELALRREEGRENERKKREREGEVVKREKKAIQARVKEGGTQFYLKDSAKKQLILEDKFERLASGREKSESDSSRKDLKRAVERRRKKNAAKERRAMPLGGGDGGAFSSPSDGRTMTIPQRKRLAGEGSLAGSKPERKRGRRG
ncbi:hypothetical protein CBS101457_000441 [Exobasidium rhododendri]|nr:hypothetical protein CBS101457_000441 [Exobasidium rhododendri]